MAETLTECHIDYETAISDRIAPSTTDSGDVPGDKGKCAD